MRKLSIFLVVLIMGGLMVAAGSALSALPIMQKPTVEDTQISKDTASIGYIDDQVNKAIGQGEERINKATQIEDGATSGIWGHVKYDEQGNLTRFLSELKRAGFVTSIGDARSLDPVSEVCNGNRSTALFSNKGAPYFQFLVPPAPDQTVKTAQPLVFRLRPDEAIMLIGRTPPEATYFSFTPYLFMRTLPDGKREMLFNSLGDSINLRTIHTIGPDPFDAPFMIIATADKQTEASVRAITRKAGYPDAIMNTMVYPSSMLRLGVTDNDTDELTLLMRVAKFTDPNGTGKAYQDKIPIDVIRITPKEPATLDPLPVLHLRVRGTGVTEMDLMDDLNQLRDAIIARYDRLNRTEYITSPFGNDAYDYTQREKNVLADTRDAFYSFAGYVPIFGFDFNKEMTLDDNDFLMVYGVMHRLTGKATYTNIQTYMTEKQVAIGNIFDDDLEGTATNYLPDNPEAKLMYALKIARNCNGESGCLEVQVPDNCTAVTLNSSTQLGIGFRSYLEPGTNIGPAATEMLYDRVIKFSP